MANVVNYVGVDVSSESFDYFFFSESGKQVSGKGSYDEKGLSKFKSMLPLASHCVMEATGIYHLRLSVFLFGSGIRVSVINPLVIKRYGQMCLSRTKTDKADAALIYSYAKTFTPSLWQPDPEHNVEMQQLSSCERLLVKQRTALHNQLSTLRKCPYVSATVVGEIERQLACIESSIKEVEAKLSEVTSRYYPDEFAAMSSIPGIGKKTAITLLALVKGFEDFETAKQLCSYFGLAPRVYQSGSSVKGKVNICKMGMSHIRMLLYMCARSASKHNTACKNLYLRLLAQGKAKKLALIAVANKLIKQLFAIVKNKQKYIDSYNDGLLIREITSAKP